MLVETCPFADSVNKKALNGKTVVVIDVLRATSVMITALENGAKKIIPVLTKNEALAESKKHAPGTYLLCGERNAKKIKDFNLGNSPLEFTRETVKGKILIMTTTNGTKALNACRKANKVYIGAFLNLSAIVEQIKDSPEVVLLCSGTNGKFSLDDGLCAGMILETLEEYISPEMDDLGHLLLKTWRNSKRNFNQALKNCDHLNFLKDNGYEKDVEYCLRQNTTTILPVYDPKKGCIAV